MNSADRDSSDFFNPVLIKELRQSFHNRGILSLMALLLIGQLLVLLVVHLVQVSSKTLPDDLGKAVFIAIITILQVCLFLSCSLGIGQRFMQERLNSELDFCKLTALSPVRIIWGKLCSALVLLLFIHSLCLPFLVIAYFLRGIAILQMLKVVLLLLPLNLVLVFSGVLCGAVGKKNSISLLLVAIFFLAPPATAMIFEMSRLWNQGFGMEEWLAVLVVPVFWCGLCFVLSVSIISHTMANRMLPIRIYLLATLLLFPAAVAGLAALTDQHVLDFLNISFSIITALVSMLIALLAVCERSRPSLHILNQCPRNILLRGGFFLLSSGSGGGILLAALLLLSLLCRPLVLSSSNTDWYEPLWYFTNTAIYMLFYAALAVFLHELMPRISSLFWLTLLLVLLLLLPSVVSVFISATDSYMLEYLTITSPFYSPGWPGVYVDTSLNAMSYCHSLPLAATALLLASSSIFRQWHALVPKSTAAENQPSLP
jgi:hypothetical protein